MSSRQRARPGSAAVSEVTQAGRIRPCGALGQDVMQGTQVILVLGLALVQTFSVSSPALSYRTTNDNGLCAHMRGCHVRVRPDFVLAVGWNFSVEMWIVVWRCWSMQHVEGRRLIVWDIWFYWRGLVREVCWRGWGKGPCVRGPKCTQVRRYSWSPRLEVRGKAWLTSRCHFTVATQRQLQSHIESNFTICGTQALELWRHELTEMEALRTEDSVAMC